MNHPRHGTSQQQQQPGAHVQPQDPQQQHHQHSQPTFAGGPQRTSAPTMEHGQSPPQVFYNGVNPQYPGLRMLHQQPPVFCVDHFLTPWECDFLIHAASDAFTPAPVVGKGVGEISASRTSSTCYLAREDVPNLMRKISSLTGKPMEDCELPQVGRYLQSQEYHQHYDAFNLDEEDGRRFASNGGQRTVTVLIYLNDVDRGGHTSFPNLKLQVKPRRGMALVFFPATVDGVLDRQALHAALPAEDTKFVSQIWIRQGAYHGQPSKRLMHLMGEPLQPGEAGLTANSPPPPTVLAAPILNPGVPIANGGYFPMNH